MIEDSSTPRQDIAELILQMTDDEIWELLSSKKVLAMAKHLIAARKIFESLGKPSSNSSDFKGV